MIYAQMVGRNEEGRFLEEVLERLSQQVDGIVFTDDCSTDNTAKRKILSCLFNSRATVYKA